MSTDKKKIVHDLPLEELLKIAANSDEAIVMDKLTEAAKFIYDIGLKQGDDLVLGQMIYFNYRLWKGWSNKRQPKAQFFKDFSKYFKSHRTKDGMSYFVNSKALDLSEDTYWQMRADLRNEKAKRKKKKQS